MRRILFFSIFLTIGIELLGLLFFIFYIINNTNVPNYTPAIILFGNSLIALPIAIFVYRRCFGMPEK
jgi:hypothetical protein